VKLILKLAWRNIWRNKRRSFLTLLAVIFATTSAIAMRGFQFGTYDINIRYVGELMSGFLQIQRIGYQKNPSLRKNFKMDSKIIDALKSEDNIKGFAPRVAGSGLISMGDKTQGAAIFGIAPEYEANTSKIMNKLTEGGFFRSDTSFDIVVGIKLLELLKAKIGDEVVVLAQGADGSMGNFKFRIVGTVKFGFPDLDRMSVFMGLKTAQELFALYGRINMIAINVYDLHELDETKKSLADKLTGTKLTVLDWGEVMPDFKNSIDFDNVSGALMMFILIVIVAFGILNTILMSVTERFKEFGISLSIGMSQMKLVSIVMIEAVFLTLIGLIFGNIFGYLFNYYFMLNPVQFGAELTEMYAEFGFIAQMKSSVTPKIFINTTLVMFVVSIVASIYPAIKVYRLEPLKGIRYT